MQFVCLIMIKKSIKFFIRTVCFSLMSFDISIIDRISTNMVSFNSERCVALTFTYHHYPSQDQVKGIISITLFPSCLLK